MNAILGISALDKDSTASLLLNGRLRAAVSEERLTRLKQQNGFPRLALAAALKIAGISPREIDRVVYPFHPAWREARLILAGWGRNAFQELLRGRGLAPRLRHAAAYAHWVLETLRLHRRCQRELIQGLAAFGLADRLEFVDHHLAHAAAAYMASGFQRCLVLSLDWYGSGLSGGVHLAEPTGIRRFKGFPYPHSLGLFYAQVTGALGFKPSRHEGKVVGLAALGRSDILHPLLRDRFDLDDRGIFYRSGMDYRAARELAEAHGREDVAAAYQRVLEELAVALVAPSVRRSGLPDLALVGGVCANVRLNQRLSQIEGLRRVFVYPAMGDQGSGSGAAFLMALRAGARPYALPDVFLGPEFLDEELVGELSAAGLPHRRSPDIAAEVAALLHQGRVVARFRGRMEYGPRALGHRSILYRATDPAVNDWLNRRLRRSEFMPFAPATLYEERALCYRRIGLAEHAAQFMTLTFDCTEEMGRASPAAVHVDGSARPQLVTRAAHPDFHRILTRYRELSGIPTVVNTSFNMHEEPIVCTPRDAVRAFVEGELDVLAMGDHLAVTPAHRAWLDVGRS